jgi:hypothetical protein
VFGVGKCQGRRVFIVGGFKVDPLMHGAGDGPGRPWANFDCGLALPESPSSSSGPQHKNTTHFVLSPPNSIVYSTGEKMVAICNKPTTTSLFAFVFFFIPTDGKSVDCRS